VSVTAKTAKYTAVQKLKKSAAAESVQLTCQASKAKLPSDGATRDYKVLLDGKTVEADISVNGTTVTATIIGLSANTPYKFVVREIAMIGDTVLNTSLDAKVTVKTLRLM